MKKDRLWLLATKGLILEFEFGIIDKKQYVRELNELEKHAEDWL